MSSLLVQRMLEDAGLLPIVALRGRGVVPTDALLADAGRGRDGSPLSDILARADLLAIGAAADRCRRAECGDEVRVFVPRAPESLEGLVVLGRNEPARGGAFCRRIAMLRLLGPIGQRIAIDFAAVGIELAQVALSFGATDLAGPIATRRGLPLAEHDGVRQNFKRRELAGNIERAGFTPVFVATDAADLPRVEPAAGPPDRPSKAHGPFDLSTRLGSDDPSKRQEHS